MVKKQYFVKLCKKKHCLSMSLFCFKVISILQFMSFFWNTAHQMLIPAITVGSSFTNSYLKNAALKGGCDSFGNGSTLM